MTDLKEAIREVFDNCIELTDVPNDFPDVLKDSVFVKKEYMDRLMLIYNICFVEPENDLEFQAWRQS